MRWAATLPIGTVTDIGVPGSTRIATCSEISASARPSMGVEALPSGIFIPEVKITTCGWPGTSSKTEMSAPSAVACAWTWPFARACAKDSAEV